MLPRGAKFVHLLQIRQRLGVRMSCCKLSLGLATHLLRIPKRVNRCIIVDESATFTLSKRLYTENKSETEKIPATPADRKSEIAALGEKTKKLCGDNTKIDSHTEPPSSPVPISAPIQHASPTPSPQIKKYDIETSKGTLSITTTIEDSKINDIVFEKTKSTSLQAPIPSGKLSTEEVTADAAKKLKIETAKIEDVIKKVELKVEPGAKMHKQFREKMREITEAATAAAQATSKSKHKKKAAAKALQAESELSKLETVSRADVTTKKHVRTKVDFNRSSLERNFITPTRAMSDFMLKASDLETLVKIKRRSPYEQEPPITVYWRKDVEARAIEVWGSRENLLNESLKREVERKKYQQNIFTVKRRLRDYRREVGARTVVFEDNIGLKSKSGKVVLIAIGINMANFLFKVGGWILTGSHSMFAESIHSLSDTANQAILAYGIHKSYQMADSQHPYGYSNMRYVSALISGVGIFFVSSGLSIYHGITGLINPQPSEDFFWAFFILGGSLVAEGATLLIAINEIHRSAKLRDMSFRDYVLASKDPCVNVVLTEDMAAVTSVVVAATCMGLTSLTGSPIFDAVGSLLIGGILGGVASFIVYTNAAALVGKSISEDLLNKINTEIENDVMIRAIHDVKGIDMGASYIRYKAEMDFDGRELTRSYLDKQDLSELLKTVKSFQTTEELEDFLLKHGENIVDLMGGEIDRIEMKLRKKFPELRHCDLEIL